MATNTNGIATLADLAGLNQDFNWTLINDVTDKFCPTYKNIIESGNFEVNGSYTQDQLVKYADILSIPNKVSWIIENIPPIVKDGQYTCSLGDSAGGPPEIRYFNVNIKNGTVIMTYTKDEWNAGNMFFADGGDSHVSGWLEDGGNSHFDVLPAGSNFGQTESVIWSYFTARIDKEFLTARPRLINGESVITTLQVSTLYIDPIIISSSYPGIGIIEIFHPGPAETSGNYWKLEVYSDIGEGSGIINMYNKYDYYTTSKYESGHVKSFYNSGISNSLYAWTQILNRLKNYPFNQYSGITLKITDPNGTVYREFYEGTVVLANLIESHLKIGENVRYQLKSSSGPGPIPTTYPYSYELNDYTYSTIPEIVGVKYKTNITFKSSNALLNKFYGTSFNSGIPAGSDNSTKILLTVPENSEVFQKPIYIDFRIIIHPDDINKMNIAIQNNKTTKLKTTILGTSFNDNLTNIWNKDNGEFLLSNRRISSLNQNDSVTIKWL